MISTNPYASNENIKSLLINHHSRASNMKMDSSISSEQSGSSFSAVADVINNRGATDLDDGTPVNA